MSSSNFIFHRQELAKQAYIDFKIHLSQSITTSIRAYFDLKFHLPKSRTTLQPTFTSNPTPHNQELV